MPPRTKLTLTRDLLARAADNARIDATLVPNLWNELDAVAPNAYFNAANVFCYLGAMVVISAMTWYLTEAWNTTSGLFKFGAALTYAAIFAGMGTWLRERPGMRVPSGLLFTAAVCMTPLAVYGFESATNFWLQQDPGKYTDFYVWIRGSWVPLELGTIAAGLLALWRVRFPFLVAPFASWFLSMDLASLAFHTADWSATWHERALVSVAVGFVTLLAALIVDRATREDYAFWLYLFGCLSFWNGIWWSGASSGEAAQFAVLVLGLAFLAASLVLGRRVLAVFGCLECTAYMGHLAWDFRDALSFPVAMTAVGLGIIGLGIAYQRNLPRIEAAANAAIPEALRKYVPRSRIA
jgi:hypothetical protein